MTLNPKPIRSRKGAPGGLVRSSIRDPKPRAPKAHARGTFEGILTGFPKGIDKGSVKGLGFRVSEN